MNGARLLTLCDAYALAITTMKAAAYGGVVSSCALQVAKPRLRMIVGLNSVTEYSEKE